MKFFQKRPVLRVLSITLVAVLTLSLAACGDKPSSKPESGSIISNSSSLSSDTSSDTSSGSESSSSGSSGSSGSSSSSSSGSSTSSGAGTVQTETRSPAEIQKALLGNIVSAHQQNEDVVGWLYAPGTTVNEAVVQTIDNDYYLRRTWQRKDNNNGCYYADAGAVVTNRAGLSKNTTIYGHSMDDNQDGERFSQFKKYKDKNYAADHQFIYFSTPESDMVWQVFAVFYTKTDFNYIKPNPTDAEFMNIIKGAKERSLHIFNVPVTTSDHILTLSTCTYVYDKNWPNKYRYVVMAKLLDKGAAQTPAKVETNPSHKEP